MRQIKEAEFASIWDAICFHAKMLTVAAKSVLPSIVGELIA